MENPKKSLNEAWAGCFIPWSALGITPESMEHISGDLLASMLHDFMSRNHPSNYRVKEGLGDGLEVVPPSQTKRILEDAKGKKIKRIE